MKELLCILEQISNLLITDEKYWFRGQSDISYKLIPTVFRKNEAGQFYDEAKLLREFIRHHPEAREKHNDTLELLTYAQHYGLPTRLLDWSTNLLVAIYFACNKDTKKDAVVYSYRVNEDLQKTDDIKNIYQQLVSFKDLHTTLNFIYSEIASYSETHHIELQANNKIINKETIKNWMLDFSLLGSSPIELVEKISEDEIEYYSRDILSYSVPYEPMLMNERIKRQQGCFTIHGGKIIEGSVILPIIEMDKDRAYYLNDFTKRVQKTLIPADYKNEILKQLAILGITDSSMFPEVQNQSEYIKSQCISPLQDQFNADKF